MDGSTGRHDAWRWIRPYRSHGGLLWCCGTAGQWNRPVIGIQDRHAARLMCFYRAEHLLEDIPISIRSAGPDGNLGTTVLVLGFRGPRAVRQRLSVISNSWTCLSNIPAL